MSPTRYVCGFAFHDGDVLLIEKQRPDWQRGKWNGVGGHIEPGESDAEAMRREFREETGADVHGWDHVATLVTDHGSEVVFFRALLGSRPSIRQTTDEEPRWWSAFSLPVTIPNLRWLIPLALNEYPGRGMPFHITETAA